jgi:hypothetical protein
MVALSYEDPMGPGGVAETSRGVTMNMDVWYDLLVRELTDLDRAEELRQDAEEVATPADIEEDATKPA